MPAPTSPLAQTLPKDIAASIAVFLVAVPLCLGIALASNAPLISGILSGIIGGIVVGVLSGSHKSVSGPAAGLTAVVAAQIAALGSFEAFLAAVVIAGAMQLVAGALRMGSIAAFFPTSVIKGLLAAIGIILILKQIPHLVGHDKDAEGEMSFDQPDHENTFSELLATLPDVQTGALIVGILSVVALLLWDRSRLKKLPVPGALVVVVLGVVTNMIFRRMGYGSLAIDATHLVNVPTGDGAAAAAYFATPAMAAFARVDVYFAAFTLAIVASLETLLNVQAVDKVDPDRQISPPNRELLAQGLGNMLCGFIGGLPLTSVIVRSSVNVQAGGRTKLTAILHGVWLVLCVAVVPWMLNEIPLSALAAILILTGFKLASPALFRQMWAEGMRQFLPFIVTIVAIVATDLLKGIIVGLIVSLIFIMRGNLHRPLRRVVETHTSGELLRIELANQVSFLNRAVIERTLHEVPRGGHVLIDARQTDYIDPDVHELIKDFLRTTSKAHGVEVSVLGLEDHFQVKDDVSFIDFTSREVQGKLTPATALELLKNGNRRFLYGQRISRDFPRQIEATAAGQFPIAVCLSCIDSRAPAEVIFDLGIGDLFNVRVAGNIAATEQLGSMEYACAVAGAKLVVVMGHTSCGAVNASVDLLSAKKSAFEATGCGNLDGLVIEIQQAIDLSVIGGDVSKLSAAEKAAFCNESSRRNVLRTIRMIRERSATLEKLVQEGRIAIVGALYDVSTGEVSFFQTPFSSVQPMELVMA